MDFPWGQRGQSAVEVSLPSSASRCQTYPELHAALCCRRILTGAAQFPLCFVPQISRRLSAQCAKSSAVLIGLLFRLCRSTGGMKWDLGTANGGLVRGRAAGGADGDGAAALDDLFHLVNNVCCSHVSCSAYRLDFMRRVCSDQGASSITGTLWSAKVRRSLLIGTPSLIVDSHTAVQP